MVGYWKINRGSGLATAEKVFEMLVDGCSAASRHKGVTLLNYDDLVVKTAIRSLSRVKINSEYPHMAASKFLHFYNPSLFAIYDDAVIWKQVLHGQFRREWSLVCSEYNIKVWEPSERFLTTYYSWSSEIMKSTEPQLMAEFVRLFGDATGEVLAAPSDVKNYYATAFEYLL
jgi:hypothetical protein